MRAPCQTRSQQDSTVTSVSGSNLAPAVLSLYQKKRPRNLCYSVRSMSLSRSLSLSFCLSTTDPFPIDALSAWTLSSLSIFALLYVKWTIANWSVKQGCSRQLATGWAHLQLNSPWQVRSQLRSGVQQRREACGYGSHSCLTLHCRFPGQGDKQQDEVVSYRSVQLQSLFTWI